MLMALSGMNENENSTIRCGFSRVKKKKILFLLIELGRIFCIDDVNITQARPKQVLNSKVGQVAFHRKY